ncbi:MAG: Ig-like domain-containing protein, partial [Candidatus Bathyarchaeia archaeon]
DRRQKEDPGRKRVNLPEGSEVFQNRSLAASWYITAFTTEAWDVKDEKGEVISPENVTQSEAFDVASAAAKFATFRMGGTYDWKKPIAVNDTLRTFNVSSYTTPLGTFRASYISDAGKSSSGFDITATMYFLTVGFPNWGGHGVYHDPQMSAYIAKFGEELAPPAPAAEEIDHPITYNETAYYVTTQSNSTVSDFDFNVTSREITFTVDGPDGTIGFTNVTVPKDLVDQASDIMVYVDDTLVSHTLSENATHYFVYFTYQHSTHSIKILLAPPPPQPSTITCQLSKTTLLKGDSVTISGAISPAVSAPVTIQVSTDDGATWSDLTTVTSTSDGTYSYTWTPDATGVYYVRAVWAGNEQYLGATSPTRRLTVTDSPVYYYYERVAESPIYVAALIILAIAAAGVFIMLRREKKKKKEEKET